MRLASTLLPLVILTGCVASQAQAELTSPQVGWQAEFSTLAHYVSGTATILDDDTLQVDDFVYDGLGDVVYFYLGTSDTHSAFVNGLAIGEDLYGHPYSGSQGPLMIDLPNGYTLEGYHAISVWCVTANSSFGSGTFAPGTLFGDYSDNGVIDAADYAAWQDAMTSGSTLINDLTPASVGPDDYEFWRAHFGATSGSGAGAGGLESPGPVPEPATIALAGWAIGLISLSLWSQPRKGARG